MIKRTEPAQRLRRLRLFIEDLLFPEGVTCLACDCAAKRQMQDGLCEACAQALEAQRAKQEAREAMDGQPPPEGIDYVHAAFPYEDPARRLIRTLKFDGIRRAAVPLCRAMAMLPSGEESVIVPVPTTKKRLRERGFNQSLLLARGVGDVLGMKVEDALERIGEQEEQSKLPVHARMHNLQGCMRAKRRFDGERVLLVDDVFTTGATAMEAARALKEAGAKSVGVFAAAQAINPQEQPSFLRFT